MRLGEGSTILYFHAEFIYHHSIMVAAQLTLQVGYIHKVPAEV